MDAIQQEVVEHAVVTAAKKVEQALDQEIDRLQNIDEDGLEAIRERRLAEMKRAAEKRAKWKLQGHGELRVTSEREFFDRSKESERFVCIMTRKDTSRLVTNFLEHMGRIAQRHEETLFATMDVEKAPFLVERFGVRVLPSVLFSKNAELKKLMHGLSELDPTGKGEFNTIRLEQSLFDIDAITSTCIGDDDA